MKGLKHYLNSADDRQAILVKDLTLMVMRQSMSILRNTTIPNDRAAEAYTKSQVCVLVNNHIYQQDELSEVEL